MADTSPVPSLLEVLRSATFRRLAGAYTVNELGNWLGDIALAVLVYDQTGSALATAALFVASRFLPAFLAPALTARLESLETGVALPALYAAETVAFVALAALAADFSLVPIVGLAALDGTLAAAARALTRAAAFSLLESGGGLRSGNAVLNFGFTGAAAVGPALGGIVVAQFGVETALLLDAGSFFAVALMLAAARSLPSGAPVAARWWSHLRSGAAYVRERRAVRTLFAAQAVALIFFTAVTPIEVVFVKRTLGAGDLAFGALLASWGAGMISGSVVFALARHLSLGPLLLGSTLAIGLAYIGLAAAPTLVAACVLSIVGGAGNGVQLIALITAIQELTAAQFQARVASLLESLAAVMPGFGFLLGGAIAAALSPRASYLAAGLGVVLVALVAAVRLMPSRWDLQGAAEQRLSGGWVHEENEVDGVQAASPEPAPVHVSAPARRYCKAGITAKRRIRFNAQQSVRCSRGRHGGGEAMTTEPISVVIVDDHVALRRGIELLLGRWGHVIAGSARDAADGYQVIRRVRPKVVVIDLALPDQDGADLTRRLAADDPDLPILLYTGLDDRARLEHALDCGARGFAMKAGPPEELIRAIRVLAEGGSYMDPRLSQLVLERTEHVHELSPREREILGLLAHGLTGAQAAERLYLSPETVRTHVRNAMAKLAAHTRVHAVTLALNHREITFEGPAQAEEDHLHREPN